MHATTHLSDPTKVLLKVGSQVAIQVCTHYIRTRCQTTTTLSMCFPAASTSNRTHSLLRCQSPVHRQMSG